MVPTPTGGGLAISISILISILLLGSDDTSFATSLGAGVILIGIIGWIDIHKEVSVIIRAVLYLLASIWAVWQLGWVKSIAVGSYSIEYGWLSSLIAIIWVSWLVNLYNFMDGTDGLAGVQAFSTGLFGSLFFILSGQYAAGVICLTIVFSASGFLVWNWSPAKIFMGDVGSCTLGFTFGVLAVYGEVTDSVPMVAWLILLAIFISDASFTLLKRIMSGETWYRAHNTHAYQRLVQSGVTHGKLAACVFCLNIFVLGPLAYFVWVSPEYAAFTLFTVYLVLGLIWLSVQRTFFQKQ